MLTWCQNIFVNKIDKIKIKKKTNSQHANLSQHDFTIQTKFFKFIFMAYHYKNVIHDFMISKK